MDVLIIEDEQAAAELLKKLLFSFDKSINIISVIDSIEKSVEWLNVNSHPDLIFLDIQLSDGLSFNIFKQVEVNCPIIFTTAYDQYALNAFEINSIDYLLKPISLEKLEKSILKFEKIQKSYSKAINADMNRLLAKLSISQNSFKTRFLVNKSDHSFIVEVNEIAYFISDQKVVFAVTKDKQKHMLNEVLDSIAGNVDPSMFFRINRQMIVSIDSIKKINNYFNYKLKLELFPPMNDDNTIVSRAKVKEFKEWVTK